MKVFSILLFSLLMPSLATAAVLFTEDFESYSANANLNTSGAFGTVSGLAPVVRDESTSTVFGTPNQYGEFYDSNGSAGIRTQSTKYTEASGAVTTFQFDFYEVSGGGSSSMGVGYANDDLNTGGSRARVNMSNGSVTNLSITGTNSYLQDTRYTFYMIFNDTNSAVVYDGGTLAAFTADIWLQQDGGFVYFAGTTNATNTDTGSYSVGFRTFNSALQDVDIDNVTLFEGAASVPEPSGLMLGALGSLVLLRRRR